MRTGLIDYRLWIVAMLALMLGAVGCGDEKKSDDEDGGVDGGPTDGGGEDTEPAAATVTAEPPLGPAPHQVEFTCEATGGSPPYRYVWDFGDGAMSAVRNSSHTYVEIGPFRATCTVTDASGEEFQGHADILVEDPDLQTGPVIDELQVTSNQEPGVPPNCAVVGQDTVELKVLAHDQSESQGPPDPDGGVGPDGGTGFDPLIYQWVFESKPAGSVAPLNNAAGYNPTFVPDREGTYVVRVFVSDDQAGALSLVTGTITVEAGVGNRLVPLAGASLGEGRSGEIHPEPIQAEVQNFCGAKAGNVAVQWTSENAVLPTPLPPFGGLSSPELDNLGWVQMVGVRNGCPPLPGSASVTGTPFYATPQPWFPEMESTTWNWDVIVGPARRISVELDRNVPVIDSAGDPGEMAFDVRWSDGCGNESDEDGNVSFQANIVTGASCNWSTGGVTWQGSTAASSWPTIHCDNSEDVTVTLTGVTGGVAWGGECVMWDFSMASWYHDAIYGPINYWTWGYYEMLGPYSGSDSRWFDATEIPAYGWEDWYYLYTPIGYSTAHCSDFLGHPHPYRLEWWQAHRFGSGAGGYLMGSYFTPSSISSEPGMPGFDLNDPMYNWWATDPDPAYGGNVAGFDAWTGSSRWGPASVDLTEAISRFACTDSMASLYLYWLYYVGADSELIDRYWMIDDIELWGWCDWGVDSEFIAGPYFEPQVVNATDGVIDCESQPATVTINGYDENGNRTPGAEVVVNYTGPGGVDLVEVHRGDITSSGSGTATIALGPQGDAILFFEANNEGNIDVTAVAAAGGSDHGRTIELFPQRNNERDPNCDNYMDDDCDGLTDCDDDGCFDAPPCLPDLVPQTSTFNYNTASDLLTWSFRVQNVGNNDSGNFDAAVYVMDQGDAPAGAPAWVYSVDWGSGAMIPGLATFEIYPPIGPGPIDDYDYPYGNMGLAPGNYTIYLVIDHTGMVAEADELNNVAQQNFTVVGPNLAEYTGTSHVAAYNAVGPMVDLDFYYQNDGDMNINSIVPNCADVTVYLMTDAEVPPADTPLVTTVLTDEICVLASGSWNTSMASLDASSLVGSTDYDLYFMLDSGDWLVETDDTPADNLVGPIPYTHP